MSARAWMIVAAGCFLVAVGKLEADDKDKKDLDALQGTWKMETLIVNGRKDDNAKDYSCVIEEDKYAQFSGGEEQVSGKLKLNSAKSPKVIAMTAETGPEKGITDEGIYSLDGDTLKICMNDADRKKLPSDFTSKEGSDRTLMVLKREKK